MEQQPVAHCVLIIDDDREMVTLGRLILERDGFEVVSAKGGQEGLDILNKPENNIELVLLDIMMLGMDGWQVLQTIRANEKFSNLPVIMLTARHYLENETETSTYAGMFDGYVVKPFVVKELIKKINTLINRASS